MMKKTKKSLMNLCAEALEELSAKNEVEKSQQKGKKDSKKRAEVKKG